MAARPGPGGNFSGNWMGNQGLGWGVLTEVEPPALPLVVLATWFESNRAYQLFL